jgi:hypothetical protein
MIIDTSTIYTTSMGMTRNLAAIPTSRDSACPPLLPRPA